MNRARLLRTLYRELELCEAEIGNDARCYDIMRNRLESMRQQSLRRTPEKLESNNIIERMHELDNMAARAKRRWLRGQMHWFGAETRQQSKTELELQISNQRYWNDNDSVNSFSD